MDEDMNTAGVIHGKTQPLAFKAADPRNHACPHDNGVPMQGKVPRFFDPDPDL